MGVGGHRHALSALPPEKNRGTQCTGGRAGLDCCGKSRPHPDSMPGLPRP